MPTPEESILTDLAAVADEIDENEAARDGLYARRRGLFRRGRALKKPIPWARMGKAARISEPAVINATNDRPSKRAARKAKK